MRVNFNDFNDIKQKLVCCENLGISNIILEPIDFSQEISTKLIKEIEKQFNLTIFYRHNLKMNHIKEFKKKLKFYNRTNHIISVESSNKEIQIHAARDSRVDILSFSDPVIIKSLTQGITSLVKQNNSFIEFSLAPIMVQNFSMQSKNLRNLYRFIHLVRSLKAEYIISGNFDNVFDYRHPRNLISVCHTLLDIPIDEAKKLFKVNPIKLIKRAKKRMNTEFLREGIKLVKSD